MSELVLLSDKAAADRLAHQFYTVELNEQKRLQAIMDHHSRESGAMLQATRFGDNVGSGGQWKDQRYKDREEVNRLEGWAQGKWHDKGEGYYPFSITAGIERGAKNR
jgi:protein-tyrosine phosphatase